VIWVIGCRGMLGREIVELLGASGLSCVGTDSEVDITEPGSLRSFAAGQQIEWIVNCAAYTAVDRAEEEPDAARALNTEGAGNIARTACEIGARMVHISTDYVFDGRGVRPYRENDPVAPLSVYGRTKAEGEELVQAACSESYIVRTAWLYGKHGNNFVHKMLKLMGERDTVRVVADQRGSPTNAEDLAVAIMSMVGSGLDAYGVYHYTSEGDTSWYDFAVAIREEAREAGAPIRNCRIEPINTAQYPTKATRPMYSVLCKDKIRSIFRLDVPPWRDSLRRYLRMRFNLA
jgi:dTDP-4-dehydrorhamnose reductase